MKIKYILLSLFLLSTVAQVSGQSKWQLGARAGIVAVPYQLSAERLGSGVRLGLFLQPPPARRINLALMLDYQKVNNLLIEKLENFIMVLPDGQYRGREFLSVSGYAEFRLGFQLNHVVMEFAKAKLKAKLAGFAGVLSSVRASEQSQFINNTSNAALLESESILTFPGTNSGISTSRNTTEDGNIVYSGGAGLIYELAAGPQIACSVQFDLNDRFALFSGSSDARLTQLQIGFNYPFSTKLK